MDQVHSQTKNDSMIRPPVKWHGGKHYLCKRIIAQFRPHHTYVEPFGGAASVLLNKEPSKVEVYNDIDDRLTRFFRVLRTQSDEFIKQVTLTPYSEIEFIQAGCNEQKNDLEQARQDFVRWRQSRGGREDDFSYTLHRSRRHMADVVSGYLSAIDKVLPIVVERFRRVQIVCRKALKVIDMWDSKDTLFYCDPTYMPETRTTPKVYRHEMTPEDHENLLERLLLCEGMVFISGYPSDLYEDLLKGWEKMTVTIANHAAGGKKKKLKTEVLWMKR